MLKETEADEKITKQLASLIPPQTMRRLALHASALSDAEYEFFTKSLREIADDDLEPATETATSNDVRFEEISIGVREARAWFRGRFSRVSLSSIDGILKLFAPNLGRQDVIKGTEFFAALRLVTHAENGNEIDRSLAFVQVLPPGRPPSPIKRAANESRSPSPTRVAEFLHASPLRHNDPSAASVMITDSGIINPYPISYPQQSPQSQLADSTQHSAYNPFVLSGRGNDPKLPPLPPRKPLSSTSNSDTPLPPPRRAASPRVERSISPSMRYSNTPPIPPKPSQHITSTLIKQSLQARKIAQSMKKAEEQLDKERVLQVLKSSSIVTGAYPLAGASVVGSSVVIGTNIHNQHQHQHPTAGSSRAKSLNSLPSSISSGSEGGQRPQVPPLPKRRTGLPSQQPSPPLSDSSLEQVALASSLPHPEFSLSSNSQDNTISQSRSSNPFNKDDLPNHPLPAPPPTHPDRNPTFGYHQLNPSPKPLSRSPPQLKTQNVETFEAIYGSISPQPISPFRSASGGSVPANPRGPNTIVTAESQTRPFRSQSLSHQSPVSQAHLPPPVRRRRPESIHHLGNAEDTRSLSRHSSLRSPRGVGHRKSSLSLSSTSSFRSHTSSPFTDDTTLNRLNSGASTSSVGGSNSASGVVGNNIQRTIEALHHIHGQLQPKLEKARYKAEAGLSKRGYVRNNVCPSGDESATAVESDEQKSLTRESDSNTKGRWLETPIGRSLQAPTEVEIGDESGSDEIEWDRGRDTYTAPMRRSNITYPQYEFDNSPERAEG